MAARRSGRKGCTGILVRRSGLPSQTWRTFLRNHPPHLIDIVLSTELMNNLQALFEQVVQAPRRWLNQMVERWIRRFLGHPALVITPPNDITRPVDSPRVIIRPVGAQDAAQMPLVQYDDVVQTLTTDTAHQPFHIWRLPGAARRDLDFFDT